mgnify:CR=1 FL=1
MVNWKEMKRDGYSFIDALWMTMAYHHRTGETQNTFTYEVTCNENKDKITIKTNKEEEVIDITPETPFTTNVFLVGLAFELEEEGFPNEYTFYDDDKEFKCKKIRKVSTCPKITFTFSDEEKDEEICDFTNYTFGDSIRDLMHSNVSKMKEYTEKEIPEWQTRSYFD